jgi:hypothetical protein
MQPPVIHKIEVHANVIGRSIAGLFATPVLSDYIETVILDERDHFIPNQGEHPGVLQLDCLKQIGATELNFS